MKISDPILQIKIGANVTPETPNLSGPTHVGFSHQSKRAGANGVFAARLIFSAAAQTATIAPTTGEVTLSAAGTAQVIARPVTAAGGVTATGNLTVTVTSAKVVGSPLALLVPVTLGQNDAAVAAAIAAKLAATPVVSNFFKPTAGASSVNLKSHFAFANDATLNLSITTGLGVSNGSSAAIAGVLGVLMERSGGDGLDIYGGAWVYGGFLDIVISGQAPGTSFVTGAGFSAPILAGVTAALSYNLAASTDQVITAAGPAIVDIIANNGVA